MLFEDPDNQRERVKMIDRILADPGISDMTRAGIERSRQDALDLIAAAEQTP